MERLRYASQLAKAIGATVSNAAAISKKITGIFARAAHAEQRRNQGIQAELRTLPAGTATALAHEGGLFGGVSQQPDGGGLQALIRHAPPVATDIERRLAHFRACEKDAERHLFQIDKALWFTDEPLPSKTKIDAAYNYFVYEMSTVGGADGARNIFHDLTGCVQNGKATGRSAPRKWTR